MTRSKGKLVALAAVLVGITILGALGFACRGWIVEEYYIWGLRSKDRAVRDFAAARLGEMRSVRAVPALLATVIRLGDEDERDITQDTRVTLAIGKMGRSALPPLSTVFGRGEPWTNAAYSSLTLISVLEGLDIDVESLLSKVEKESPPGSALHQAATDLIPKVKAFQSQIEKKSGAQVSP